MNIKNPCIKCINKWIYYAYGGTCWKRKLFHIFNRKKEK